MALKLVSTDNLEGFVERTVRNFLDLFVLGLLRDRSRHGYELMQQLAEQTGTHVSPGTLYPLLYELEGQGLVFGRWTDTEYHDRRIYTITDKGLNYHDSSLNSIGHLLETDLAAGQVLVQ